MTNIWLMFTGLHRRVYGNWYPLPQQNYTCTTNVGNPPVAPLRSVETLTHVGNFPLPQPTSVWSSQVAYTRPAPERKMGSLKLVGNFTHPPNITQDQLIALLNSKKAPIAGCAASCNFTTTQKTLHSPTMPHDSDSGIIRYDQTSSGKEIPRQLYLQYLCPRNNYSGWI